MGRDFFYIVLELIEGGELFDRIVKKDHYSERDARVVMKQMAAAMTAAHAVGVVHRDLKPENILLASKSDDTSIKVADLGFAKIAQGKNTFMTTPCGTPAYVAPEVISGKPYTASCDVWSLGCILYHLLVGCVRKNPPGTRRAPPFPPPFTRTPPTHTTRHTTQTASRPLTTRARTKCSSSFARGTIR